MLERQAIPFLIASSVTAELPPPYKFNLQKTVEIAKGRADGTQLYVNPEKFDTGEEDVHKLKDMLAAGGLNVNVVHIPGYALPEGFKGKSGQAMGIASELLVPVTDVGKLCIVHHDPYSGITDEKIVDSACQIVDQLSDSEIAIGLEHFHPFDQTTQSNLSEQVDRYISLLQRLQEQVPTFAVFDIGRFYTANNANVPPAPLTDTDHQLVEKMCRAVQGQKVLVHAADINEMTKSFRESGNATPIGTGVLTPIYQEMIRLGHKYEIKWIGVVDETESSEAISDRETVRKLFTLNS